MITLKSMTQDYPLELVLDQFANGTIRETFSLDKGEKWDHWAQAYNENKGLTSRA